MEALNTHVVFIILSIILGCKTIVKKSNVVLQPPYQISRKRKPWENWRLVAKTTTATPYKQHRASGAATRGWKVSNDDGYHPTAHGDRM